MREPLRVGIVGAGAVAFAVAAFLEQAGHRPKLWSPSGNRTERMAAGDPLIATGALEGRFAPAVAKSAQALVEGADVVLLALPANGHKTTMDAIAPFLVDSQAVIISSQASFGALYLSKLLVQRGIEIPIVAWGTTLTGGRQTSDCEVMVSTVRKQVDIATVPERLSVQGLSLCENLAGQCFVDRGGLMAIALSNLNPQNHLGIALCNLTRMERGENWSQGQNVTPAVGRLLEALDKERLAIAAALNLKVRSIFEHFHLSFHVPVASVSDMNQKMHEEGRGGSGPPTAESRYVLEDVPFGLVVTEVLGQLAGRPTI
ncbi:MAG: NAD/NADP octopine/nopaline dehydrogenase family protein, partial [Pseudomonadota bacterium]